MRYKIQIDPTPKVIYSTKEIPMGCCFPDVTIAMLRKMGVGDDDTFDVYCDDGDYILRITSSRIETADEVAARVAKDMAYNQACDVFHAKTKL